MCKIKTFIKTIDGEFCEPNQMIIKTDSNTSSNRNNIFIENELAKYE